MKESKRLAPLGKNPSKARKVANRVCWFIGLSSNAIMVILGATIAYCLEQNDNNPFTLIDPVAPGLPPFVLPPFSTSNNGTDYSFKDIASEFGSALVFIPLVGILESVAVAKSFSNGKSLDATQEMIALGVCSFMGSFVGSMPVTGSFTRSAVNNSSGVKTQGGGLITGVVVLLALAYLTSTFAYIPKTTLAAVVITAMIYLFDYEAIIYFWNTKKLDLIPFTATFLVALFFGVEYGIIAGVAVHIIFVLYPVARPKFNMRREEIDGEYLYVIVPSVEMQFPVADYFRDRVLKDCQRPFSTVVIDGLNVRYMDATVARIMQDIADELSGRDQKYILWNFKPKIVKVCTAMEPSLKFCCRSGTLEEVVKEVCVKGYEIQDDDILESDSKADGFSNIESVRYDTNNDTGTT